MKQLKPLALAVSLTFALSACHTAQLTTPSPIASTPATPSTTAATSPHVFDVNELDRTINACQDFNGFVNDKWIAANPIPADRTRWGAFDQLAEKSLNTQHAIVESAAQHAAQAQPGSIEQKIGWLYQSGMDSAAIDHAGFDPIKPKLADIAALKHGSDVAAFIIQEFAKGDAQVFSFGAGADFRDAKLQIGFANQGGLGLPTRDYYFEPKYAEIRQAYLDYIVKSLTLTGVAHADAEQQARAVLTLETELARASLSPTEMRDLDNQYHFVSVEDADKLTPGFKWDTFFAAQNLTIGRGFSLSQPKFFTAFGKLLSHAPIAQWQAYLRFHAIDDASPYLSSAFQDNSFDFYGKTLAGQPEQKPRWKRVLSAVNGSMGQALGQLYVAQTFTPAAKQHAEKLVSNVRDALKERIQHLDWMSPATKQKAIDKWNKFLPKIGYPDNWRSWDGLQVKADDYYGNLMAAAKFNYYYDIAKIGKPTDRTLWDMTPQTVNAYYDPSTNTINFPAAILQAPFFYADGDDAINYGGIGAVIGHESSHGFDDQGSQFDGDGNKANWWTAQDKSQFEERTGKLVAQFNAYAPIKTKPDLHVNGELTLGENIADLGGLNVAYDALQTALRKNPAEAQRTIDGYTQDQRYFLSWARVWRSNVREKSAELALNVDPHAPASLRAIGAPSNMAAFASSFQCRPGDTMVRSTDKQVNIW